MEMKGLLLIIVMLGTYVYNPESSDKIDYSDPALINKADFGKILYCADENNDPNKNTQIYCNTVPGFYTTSYILKSFIPYSMQYTKAPTISNSDCYDITINYTLDNYISVSGTIKKGGKEVYYTKSGYLINPDEISFIKIGEYNLSNIQDLPLNNVDDYIDSTIVSNVVSIEFKNGVKISSDGNSATSTGVDGNEISDNISALKYYIKAFIFSKWVSDNLSDLSESYINNDFKNLQSDFNIKQSGFSLEDNVKLFYDYGDSPIFLTDGNWNVENSDSNFYEHKRNVIQNSIQYNLNLAMAIYNAGEGDEYYQMPILSDVEWDKLLSNVSILAFMQGFPCGLKTYSNYQIVSSTNNEVMTNVDSIYYIPMCQNSQGLLSSDNIKQDSELDTCHRIDCVDSSFISELNDNTCTHFQSFASKEIKYDKKYDYSTNSYVYDHGANTCLYCIVNSNYNSVLKDAMDYYNEFYILNDIKNKKPDIYKKYGDSFEDELTNINITGDQIGIIKKLLKAEYIAIGKIRNNTYKSLAFKTNYGIYTENFYNNNTLFSRNDGINPNINDTNIDLTPYENIINNRIRIDNGTNSNIIINDEARKNCYEIAITLELNLGNGSSIKLSLGNEQKNLSTIRGVQTQTIFYTNSSDWDGYIHLDNTYGGYINTIKLLSITYKYK